MSKFSKAVEFLIIAEMSSKDGDVSEVIGSLLTLLARSAASAVPNGSQAGDAMLNLCHVELDRKFTEFRNTIKAGGA